MAFHTHLNDKATRHLVILRIGESRSVWKIKASICRSAAIFTSTSAGLKSLYHQVECMFVIGEKFHKATLRRNGIIIYRISFHPR